MKHNKNYLIAGNSTKSNTQLAKQRLMALAMQAANRQASAPLTTEARLKRKRKAQKAKADRKRNWHQQRSTW